MYAQMFGDEINLTGYDFLCTAICETLAKKINEEKTIH